MDAALEQAVETVLGDHAEAFVDLVRLRLANPSSAVETALPEHHPGKIAACLNS
jgi:hypothetical protein